MATFVGLAAAMSTNSKSLGGRAGWMVVGPVGRSDGVSSAYGWGRNGMGNGVSLLIVCSMLVDACSQSI